MLGFNRPKFHLRGFMGRRVLAMAMTAVIAFLAGAAVVWSSRPDPAARTVQAILKGEAFADEEW
jgi:hypothetical protein